MVFIVKTIRNYIEEINQCSDCGSNIIIRDYIKGELVCNKCGLVIEEDFIDQGPEWRAYNFVQKEKRAHTGSPINYTIHDK